jgi:TonB family protein
VAKKLPPPPPKPLNLPDSSRSGDPPQKAGRAGNYGSGSGAGAGNGTASGNSGASNRSPVAPLPPDPRIVTKAKVLNNPRPAYTEQARDNGTQGNVVVRVTLGANGKVKSASVVRGLPDGLNEKAIEAVYRLEFDPARDLAGQTVDSVITVSVNFLIGFRERDMTGVWIAADRDETPSVQFYFSVIAPATRTGLVILEMQPGVYACVPVTSSFTDGVFEAAATIPSRSCSFRWTGRTGDAGFAVEEVRSCRTGGESRRDYTLTRVR